MPDCLRVQLTVLAAVLTAQYEWHDAALDGEDVALADARPTVRLALKIMEMNEVKK